MPEKLKARGVLEHPFAANMRYQVAAALVISAGLLGCAESKKEEAIVPDSPPVVASSAPSVQIKAKPQIAHLAQECEQRKRFDEAVRKYPSTPRENLKKVLDKYEGAETVVESLSGNGCRDVIIFKPDGFDPGKKIELQYHFHGTFGNFIGVPAPYDVTLVKKGEETVGEDRIHRALSAISRKVKKGERNTILVYPLSAGRREGDDYAYNFGYDNYWMQKGNDTEDDMTLLDKQVREIIAKTFGVNASQATVTLSGHSAGGKAIMYVVQSGFIPDHIKFLEATYAYWPKAVYDALGDRQQATSIEMYVKPNTNTETSANTLLKKKGVTIIRDKRWHAAFLSYI